MNEKEIENAGYRYHHTAIHRGYTRVDERGIGVPYKGRFGEGYKVFLGQYISPWGKKSTMYQCVAYYVK